MPRLLPSLLLALTTTAAFADDIGLRVRFGLTDQEATDWSGTVAVTPGRVALIGGWRFAQQDKVDGLAGWSARTRPAVLDKRSNNPKKAGGRQAQAAASGVAMGDNGVLLTFADVTDASQVTIKTAQGEIAVKLGDVPFGKTVNQLNGAVELERTAAAVPLTDARSDDDYPSAAVGADGTAWIAYASYTPGLDRDERARSFDKEPEDLKFLATAPGADQLWLRSVKGRDTGAPIAITAAGRDIYKSAVAVDGDGRVWVVWAENASYQAFPANGTASFDLWARAVKDGVPGKPVKLSDSPESDVWPAAATDAKGRVWVAWQGAKDKVFRIWARHQEGGKWSAAQQVSTQAGNCWAPAIAAAKDGRIAIAWDTYTRGDYDVWTREFDASGTAGEARPVANSATYEARPAMTYDRDGALWISWERGGPTWGKDFGAYAAQGIGLYRERQIGLAILKDGKWMEPAAGFTAALPGGRGKGRRQNNVRVPAIEPNAETRQAGQEAEEAKNDAHNNLARIACDSAGRMWLFARSRQNDFRSPLGSLWFNWATYYDGAQWVGPILVPHSDNLLYNTPAVVALQEGGLLLAHSSDHRQDRHIVRKAGAAGNASLDADRDPFDNDLYLSRLSQPGEARPAQLVASQHPPAADAAPSPATVAERAAIARCRDYRAKSVAGSCKSCAGNFTVTPRSAATAAMTVRSKTCGATPSMWPRWTGSAAAITTTAAVANTRGGSPRRRATPSSCPAASTRCTPTSAASVTPRVIAMSSLPVAASAPCRACRSAPAISQATRPTPRCSTNICASSMACAPRTPAPRAWARTGATGIPWSSRWSRSIRARGKITSIPAPRAAPPRRMPSVAGSPRVS